MTAPTTTAANHGLELLYARRSAGDLHAPGPTRAQLEHMLGWSNLGTEHEADTAPRLAFVLSAATIVVDGAGVSAYRP